MLSNCCGAEFVENTFSDGVGMCSECKEWASADKEVQVFQNFDNTGFFIIDKRRPPKIDPIDWSEFEARDYNYEVVVTEYKDGEIDYLFGVMK